MCIHMSTLSAHIYVHIYTIHPYTDEHKHSHIPYTLLKNIIIKTIVCEYLDIRVRDEINVHVYAHTCA